MSEVGHVFSQIGEFFNFMCWLVGLFAIICFSVTLIGEALQLFWQTHRSKIRRKLRSNKRFMKFININGGMNDEIDLY